MSDAQDVKLGGWRPEPADARDIHVGQMLAVAPASYSGDIIDWRPWCSPIENQSSLSSCVGNAVVGGQEMLEIIRGDQYVDLSRLFPYFNARAAMNETDRDDGSFVRDAMNSLASIGSCPEALWPYDIDKVLIRPAWKCYREAYAHRISGFYKIFSVGEERIDEIKSALRVKCPVVFGTPVFTAFRYSQGPVAMPSGASIGGHALCIVGFDDTQKVFIVRNSWGTGWGDKGYCYMPYAYLDAAGATDFWAMTL